MRGAIALATARVERSGSVEKAKQVMLLLQMRIVWALDLLLYLLLFLPLIQGLSAWSGPDGERLVLGFFVFGIICGLPLEAMILRLHDKEIRMRRLLSEREERCSDIFDDATFDK